MSNEDRLVELKRKLAAREGKLGYRENVEAIKAEIARLEGHNPATVGDALTFIAETIALLDRVKAALEQAPALGPKALGNFVDHVEPIHAALAAQRPSLERAVAEFL